MHRSAGIRTYNRRALRRVAVTALVLALLGGTTAAFALTQALKLERSPVAAPRFDAAFAPTCGCAKHGSARLALRLRKADRIDAAIVDGDGDVVRGLAKDVERPRGLVTFVWNGRTDAGELAPDGRYRLRIHLDRQRRTIVIPNQVRLDTRAPSVEIVTVRPRTFSPDGDGRRDRLAVLYRASEIARPILLVDGRIAVRGRGRAAGRQTVAWTGRLIRRTLGPGRYDVSVQVRDAAGNLSFATAPVAVRIRYVELARERLRARRGQVFRFRVRTDAAAFRWSLNGRRGRTVAAGSSSRRLVPVRLPPAVRSGRYLLRVSARGHRDRAVVTVARIGRER